MMAARLKITSICILTVILFTYFTNAENAEESTQNGSDFVLVSPSQKAILLEPNVKYKTEKDYKTENFGVYCSSDVSKSILHIWRSVQFVLLRKPISFKIYSGANDTEVVQNYKSRSFWDPSFIFSVSDEVFDFPAFSKYCIGIDASDNYSFYLKVRTINYWKVLQSLCGSFLFLTASSLSRNTFFHYASGVSLGVLASFLILLYFISKFIPQKTASYAVLVFGYSFVFYFLNVIWFHFHDVMTQYMDFVLAYVAVVSFLSFVVCYRIGPVKSERTCNIIQWSMQALSLLAIFFSSEYREVSTAAILVILSIRFIPIQWIKWIKYLWYRCFPPKVKLLTELQYIEQGCSETKKALEDLRQYCNSPDCKVWQVVRNLKDPIRFANFIEIGSHFTDEELLEYNSEDFEEIIDDSEAVENNNTYF